MPSPMALLKRVSSKKVKSPAGTAGVRTAGKDIEAAAPPTMGSYKCDIPGKEDVTFATFVPTTASESPTPVFLFQSGYGSNSIGHAPLVQAIADKGFICIIPDREDDVKGGKDSVTALFSEGKCISALSADGTYLAAALAWVKAQPTIAGFTPDLTKVAAGGYSMGGIEALRFATAYPEDVKAVVGIDPSTQEMCEGLYNFKRTEMLELAAGLKMPSLWIGADQSIGNSEATALYAAAVSGKLNTCLALLEGGLAAAPRLRR